ncbi:MAG TPA: PadR family transcriptional regulator [Edaphobacter sp.]|uniref:PadR family transcriptional regulator n=1 Tax=Edaphobacter sp. TaxID=1934404 RepID=UPI002CBED102|nr:PadR family transcriptional regulator [Edaphobacter sp.]HUZ94804.1 PadR family transcriptional regulator [Edaphobacter sp.]
MVVDYLMSEDALLAFFVNGRNELVVIPLGSMYSSFSMAPRETNPNFMNGVPELLILRLVQQEEMYGYEIVQAIRGRTDSVIAVGEGVVYPVLHGLERDGALRSRRKTVNGRNRIYYSVTPAGTRRLADLAKGWTNLTAAIQTILTGEKHGEAV